MTNEGEPKKEGADVVVEKTAIEQALDWFGKEYAIARTEQAEEDFKLMRLGERKPPTAPFYRVRRSFSYSSWKKRIVAQQKVVENCNRRFKWVQDIIKELKQNDVEDAIVYLKGEWSSNAEAIRNALLNYWKDQHDAAEEE
ncbi:MAG: hypothetical protein ABI758_00295 [Candidatus Woesebacteria bacterium]